MKNAFVSTKENFCEVCGMYTYVNSENMCVDCYTELEDNTEEYG